MKIEFQKVSFTYPSLTSPPIKPHLQDLSFTIQSHETVGLIGASGAGKSTLLQLLIGLEKPTQGSISIDNQDMHSAHFSLTALRTKIGLVFQFPEMQLFEATVAEDVAFGLKNRGMPEAAIPQRVESALMRMGLNPAQYAGRSIEHLSQGEKRRVAIAGILAMEPEVLALDEPTSGLDPAVAGRLVTYLIDYQKQKKHGLIIASHDIEFLIETVSRFLILQKGCLVADLAMSELENFMKTFPDQLAAPRAFRLAAKLRKLGVNLPEGILSSNQLLSALADRLSN